jgi:hypothetical protein
VNGLARVRRRGPQHGTLNANGGGERSGLGGVQAMRTSRGPALPKRCSRPGRTAADRRG